MGRIIEFLRRFGNVGLFLLLQFIAFLLIVNRNDHQKKVFKSVTLSVSSSLYQVRSGITQYFYLNEQNDLLQGENNDLKREVIQLRNELHAYKFKSPLAPTFTTLPDSLFPADAYDFIACRSIKSSINSNYNYVTLNKGAMHGVTEGMGLLSPQGVAGRVIVVSKHYSLAISVLNKKFKLSAKLLKNNNVGSLSWNGEDPTVGILDFIPETATVTEGDQVVTSGYSTIFPENFVVGRVESYDNNNKDGFHTIRVKLATNFRALGNLYLVRQRYESEIDSLELNLPIQENPDE